MLGTGEDSTVTAGQCADGVNYCTASVLENQEAAVSMPFCRIRLFVSVYVSDCLVRHMEMTFVFVYTSIAGHGVIAPGVIPVY